MRIRRLLISLCCAAVCSQVYAASPPLTAESVADFFDTAFAVQQQDHRIAGAVVAVVHRGEAIFLGGYGYADIERRIPADPSRSLFRIASITKPFVWTALMQLAERGQLDLDDPVGRHLDFPIPQTFDEPIRIRHLMSHTPGFEELATGSAARSADAVEPLDAYLQRSMPRRVRPPGQHASYSNYGSALAGYLVERVSGEPWSDYVDANILEPLGMTGTNTQREMTESLRARHAVSYRYSGGEFRPMDYFYIADAPAGHISTTAADMARFMLAHLGHAGPAGERILQPQTLARLREPLFQAHPDLPPVLHGFFRDDRNGQLIYGHGGDVNGFHSDLKLLPEHDLGVFVSFNADPAASARSRLVDAFVDHFFPRPYLGEPTNPVTRQIAGYVGEYLPLRRNQSTFERLGSLIMGLQVDVDGDHLLVQDGNDTSRWVPTGDGAFTSLYGDRNLAFVNGDGRHLYIGSSLNSFERVTGSHAPSVLRGLYAAVAAVFVLAVLGWGYRAFRPAEPAAALPRLDVSAGWLHAALALYGLVQLGRTLAGDVQEFQFGVPPAADQALLLMSGNLVLGALVVVLAPLQWLRGAGSVFSRLRYAMVASAAAVNVWLAVYFNYAQYALRLVADL